MICYCSLGVVSVPCHESVYESVLSFLDFKVAAGERLKRKILKRQKRVKGEQSGVRPMTSALQPNFHIFNS
jgi:hypothetical protein